MIPTRTKPTGCGRSSSRASKPTPNVATNVPLGQLPYLPLFHASKPPFLVFTGTIFGVPRQPRQGAMKKEKPLDGRRQAHAKLWPAIW